MDKFIPVKVTGKQWAEKLLDGEIFMRPLREFGSWGRAEADASVQNSYRGDIHEGMTAVFNNPKECDALEGADPNFVNAVKFAYYVDNTEIQYFKIFSMYCMEYDPENDFFVKPDPRMKEFGDTVVIIRDFNEFLERYARAVFGNYEHICAMLSPVEFYDFSKTQKINPLFSKHISYKYQNELRLAFAEFEPDCFAIGVDADKAYGLVQNLDRVTLNIGDIRDIAYAIPIEDFLELKIKNLPLRFPMRGIGEEPSNYDLVLAFTKEQMERYKSIFVNVNVVIC